eukprot:3305579-Rhodomonas_salina.1
MSQSQQNPTSSNITAFPRPMSTVAQQKCYASRAIMKNCHSRNSLMFCKSFSEVTVTDVRIVR